MNEKWKSRAGISPKSSFWSGLETDKANLASRVFLVLCHLHLLILFLKDMCSLHNLASQVSQLLSAWARSGPVDSGSLTPTGHTSQAPGATSGVNAEGREARVLFCHQLHYL